MNVQILSNLEDFEVFNTFLYVWYGRSCVWFRLLPKVPEMEFSDRVGIENVQVYLLAPSERRVRAV